MDVDDLESLFEIMDIDHNKEIDFYEFSEVYLRLKRLLHNPDSVALLRCSESTAERRYYMEKLLMQGSEIQMLIDIKDDLLLVKDNLRYNASQLHVIQQELTRMDAKQGPKAKKDWGPNEL